MQWGGVEKNNIKNTSAVHSGAVKSAFAIIDWLLFAATTPCGWLPATESIFYGFYCFFQKQWVKKKDKKKKRKRKQKSFVCK